MPVTRGTVVRHLLGCLALSCVPTPPLAAQLGSGATYRLGGVDIYGTDAITVDAFSRRFDGRARMLFDAIQAQDAAALDTLVPALRTDIRAIADIAWVDMALIFNPDDMTAYMTFDVVERADSAARMSFAAAPAGQVEDPGGLLALWRAYEDSVLQRMMRGVPPTQPVPATCPALHCIGAFGVDASLARYERAFVEQAPRHADALLRVLREDADEADRGAAAYLLAHIDRPDAAVAALVHAMRDPGALVRNNATRVLIMAASTRRDLDIPVDVVIGNIDAPTTTSRNKALFLLLALARRPELHDRITRDAGPTLLRLLHLNQPNNHEPAWEILKLVSGESFGERDYAAWERWLRDSVHSPTDVQRAASARRASSRPGMPGSAVSCWNHTGWLYVNASPQCAITSSVVPSEAAGPPTSRC
jgi:hypothetical protein